MSIKIKNISVTYNKKTKHPFKALDNFSCEINEGSFTCIIGETGSGKSTLVQTLNGLLPIDEGTIDIAGHFLTNKKNKKLNNLRKDVGLVFQFPEYQLFEETVTKDVSFGLINFGTDKEKALEIAKDTLLSMGFKKENFEKSPFELSGGEKRRVAIAGIISLNPKVLILDEPTVGLDPITVRKFIGYLKKLNDSGTTIIAVTHDMELVYNLSNHVIALDKGKKIFDDTREKFISSNLINSYKFPDIFTFVNILYDSGIKIDKNKVYTPKSLADTLKEYLK